MASKRGSGIVPEALAAEPGMAVVSTVAIQQSGAGPLLGLFDDQRIWRPAFTD